MVIADPNVNQYQGSNGKDGIKGIDLEHQPVAHQESDE